MKQIDPTLSAIAALMGKRGGKSKSPKKLKALAQNRRKALKVRRLKLRLQAA